MPIAAILLLLPDFIKALPYLLQILLRLMDVTVKLVAWAKENNFNGWILDLEATTDGLIKAKTPEDKWNAGKKLGELIGKLPALPAPK